MCADQVNRYDRQIRAWGFETQRRLQQSKAVFFGLNHVSVECIKNLVLAGIGDVSIVPNDDSFNDSIKILSELNPNTKLEVLSDANVENYDIICVFNNTELANKLRGTGKVLVLIFGVSAYLLFNVPELEINYEEVPADPLGDTICGALLSQMIVDHLPPLENPVAVKLNYSPENLSANVSSLI